MTDYQPGPTGSRNYHDVIKPALIRAQRLTTAIQLREALIEIEQLRQMGITILLQINPAEYQRRTEVAPDDGRVPTAELIELVLSSFQGWSDEVYACIQAFETWQQQQQIAPAPAPAAPAGPQSPPPADVAPPAASPPPPSPAEVEAAAVQEALDRLQRDTIKQAQRARAVLHVLWTTGLNERQQVFEIWRQRDDLADEAVETDAGLRKAYNRVVNDELLARGLVDQIAEPSYDLTAELNAREVYYLVLTERGQAVCRALFPAQVPATPTQVETLLTDWKSLTAAHMAQATAHYLDYGSPASAAWRAKKAPSFWWDAATGQPTVELERALQLALGSADPAGPTFHPRCQYLILDPRHVPDPAPIPGAQPYHDPIAGAPAGIERAWPDLLVQVEVTGQPTSRMAWAVEVERAEYSTPRLVDKWVRDLYCYPFPLLIVT
ncbi:MAG: hypothetical protein KKA73_30485, partial [Chloroflexi bacterium]|nr:hypothetical protein [Chloroflexota bacterium]